MRSTYGVHIVWCHFILESFTSFSQVLWSNDVTDVTVWQITSNPNPRVLKIEKWKMIEMKMKNESKTNWSLLFYFLTKDFFDMLSIISYVIRIDQNIIEIDYYSYIKKARENVIHEMLEDSGSIGKTKGYDRPFKGSIVDMECGLLFVTFSNVD